jgi:uncharacterized membrane protein YfhO
MAIYSVYWLHLPNQLDIKTQGYVGVSNNPKRRLSEHKLASKNGNNQNPYLGRILNKYEVLQTIIFQGTEAECYLQEELLRPKKNIGWNANRGGITPPSKKGWKPSKETLAKRSASLKGIVRSDEWCQNLSNAKKGEKNGMFGKKIPCSEKKRLDIIKTKNLKNYDLYKQAINLMTNGLSADKTAVQLSIGREICFKLKNRTHMFFEAFPELR